MALNSTICPVCAGVSTHLLHDFGVLPQTGIYLDDPLTPFPSRRLAFLYCTDCACVFQDMSGAPRIDYADVTRGTERQFPAYAEEIVSWANTACGASGLLVEVGSNDGTFLTRLRTAGLANLLGVEPSHSLVDRSRAAGHRVENLPLDPVSARQLRKQYGPAQVVMCRHTLEHVPTPLAFLQAIRHLLVDGGYLFIEVPGVIPAIDQRLQAHDLWDEHLTYFSEATLSHILRAAGFVVDRIETRPHCGSENILCWARAGNENCNAPTAQQIELEYCASFSQRWSLRCTQLQLMASNWPRPVVAMGAAHPQSNFLHFSGLMQLVSKLVDDDPIKIGRWVPASQPVQVVAGNSLIDNARGGTILLTGFGYPSWMKRVADAVSNQDIKLFELDH